MSHSRCQTSKSKFFLHQAFRMLDEDGRGRLDAEHVKELLLSLGDRFTDEEVWTGLWENFMRQKSK